MICVITGKESTDINVAGSPLRGIVGQESFQAFRLGFTFAQYRLSDLPMPDGAASMEFKDAKAWPKLVQTARGNCKKGLLHDIYIKHNLLIFQRNDRAMATDMALQHLADMGHRSVVVEREDGEEGCTDRVVVFIGKREEIDRVLARVQELGLKHSAYGFPEKPEQIEVAETKAEGASSESTET